MTFVIILPNSEKGLAKLEEDIGKSQLSDLLEGVEKSKVKLYVPKFKIATAAKFKDQLEQVYISSIKRSKKGHNRRFARVYLQMENFTNFCSDERSDFSGITKNSKLSLTDVIQSVSLEVTKDGTTAFAASVGKCFTY
jgi:serine protease inhibitor